MSHDRVTIDAETAISLLADGDYIHIFTDCSGMIVGYDWDRKDAEEYLRSAPVIDLTGGMARSMGHGIATLHGQRLFFATDTARLDTYDPQEG